MEPPEQQVMMGGDHTARCPWLHTDVSAGVVLAPYGPEWREQRRFSVSTLRDFGLGRKSLEQWVTEEAGHLCDAFIQEAERPFEPSTLLSKAVANVIASLVYAQRFDYEDPFFNWMLKTLKESFGEDTGFVAEVRAQGSGHGFVCAINPIFKKSKLLHS
ncbi:cytochrome P450 2D26-like [Acomys russatus]|uniref:cytochrome P450 2D26-like n=1 Tax=Acomys russatus TaxID=60746 RepID=UPI0021E2B83B|nr:cytochrome P450 2D26-like [Acomys russatus]